MNVKLHAPGDFTLCLKCCIMKTDKELRSILSKKFLSGVQLKKLSEERATKIICKNRTKIIKY